LNPRRLSFGRSMELIAALVFVCATVNTSAQQTSSTTDSDLTQSIRELREQVQELRTAVSEIKSEAAQYRAENQQLRKQLESIRPTPGSQSSASSASGGQVAANSSTESRVSAIEETSQLQQSELRTLYQTKVESASNYRVRLSGLVLLNLFHNQGPVDNQDVPSYSTPTGLYGIGPVTGATMRQSEIGLEVFGPRFFGAKTSGQIQFDFGGGFPQGALDGVNNGLVRLRTGSMRLEWDNTSIIVGQDSLFISPSSPTSFASLLVPSLGYSGNLWAWTPQVRIAHKFNLGENQNISVEGGLLDNVTGESYYGSHRLAQAGESSGLPAYAARTSWTRNINGKPLTIGASGYYSRQNWGFDWTVDGWAGMTDWQIPLSSRFELSGEFYRGRAVGGLGGGIGQSVVFGGNPMDPAAGFAPLDSAGGWSQIKFTANSRLEFNAAFGSDNPFSAELHQFPVPTTVYSSVLAANRSEMMNFIFRPRSDLLFSGEYRHLRTTQIGSIYGADHVNLVMGVLF
jgi:regulator of replication initiation timing